MRNKDLFFQIIALVCAAFISVCCLSGCSKTKRTTKETDETTLGIDVARYQGTIDWKKVAQSGIDFAIIRVGYRGKSDGFIK